MKQSTDKNASGGQSAAAESRLPEASGGCFHCGLPIPDGLDLRVAIDGAERAMCCHGCEAVAAAIIAAGHENYYRVRTGVSPSARTNCRWISATS